MINYKTGNIVFNYRIAGASIHKGKVLLHKLEKDDFWALPGGRCELLEESKETIVREFYEESGLNVTVIRPLWFLENLFSLDNIKCHEVSVAYEVEIPKDEACLEQEEFYGYEGSEKIIFRWFDLEELDKIELYPTFLKTKLKKLSKGFEHIVHRDNQP